MLWVLFSVFCSVTVSVLFKLARRYSVNIEQMIAWNYPVALLLSWYFFRPDFSTLSWAGLPVYDYGVLGFLLPAIFLALAASIRYTGIVRTELAQRLSLFIPLLAAFLLFGEQLQPIKMLGLIIGFAAILCSIKWQQPKNRLLSVRQGTWLYPLLVFVGMGIIDILFKQIALNPVVPYRSSLVFVFLLCMVVSFLYIGYRAIWGNMRFSLSGTLWGLSMGLFNFGNIIFYMKAHQAIANNPSIVFSSMNIGVIVLGALVGMFLFKEKLSPLNRVGLVLAIMAILIISLG